MNGQAFTDHPVESNRQINDIGVISIFALRLERSKTETRTEIKVETWGRTDRKKRGRDRERMIGCGKQWRDWARGAQREGTLKEGRTRKKIKGRSGEVTIQIEKGRTSC